MVEGKRKPRAAWGAWPEKPEKMWQNNAPEPARLGLAGSWVGQAVYARGSARSFALKIMNDEEENAGATTPSLRPGVVRPFFRILAGIVAFLFEAWVVVALATGIVPRGQSLISLAPPFFFGIVFAVAAFKGEFPIGNRNQ